MYLLIILILDCEDIFPRQLTLEQTAQTALNFTKSVLITQIKC